ncbi:MAG: carboxypeptidase regulatory-like domain-containing protein [Planctomycetota bacterium]|nr:carboxypeptidase regulatory-like domain-containing protein [Planctomycetota bacterium]
MKMWGLALVVLAVGVAAWLVLADRPRLRPVPTPAPAAPAVEAQPELQGAEFEAQLAHARREAARERARRYARCGSGQGGFFHEEVEHGAFRISGRVLGADGEPVPEAEVTLVGDANEHNSDYPEDDGRFFIEYGQEFPMRVVLTAPGHVPHVGPWKRYANREHVDIGTIRLARGQRIAGQVVDEDGEGQMAWIVIAPDDDPPPAWWRTAEEAQGAFSEALQTGPDGIFAYAELPPGRYRLRVDTSASVGERVLEGIGAGRTDLRIVMPLDAAEDTGEPWLARVELSPADCINPLAEDERRSDWSGIETPWFGAIHERNYHNLLLGHVIEARLLGTGPAHAVINDPVSGFAPTYVRGFRPGSAKRSVRLERGLTVTGRLKGPPTARLGGIYVGLHASMLADGTGAAVPAPGQTVVGTYWREATTDARGQFVIPGLLPGTAHVRLGTQDFELQDRTTPVRLDGTPLTLRAVAYPTVEVTCTLPEGSPGALIQWAVFDLDPTSNTQHGDDAVSTEGKRHATWTVRLSTRACDHELHLRSTTNPILGPVKVRIPRGARTVHAELAAPQLLHGRIVDAAGRPLPRAWVFLREVGDPAPFTPVMIGTPAHPEAGDPVGTVTRLNGSFELGIPRDGNWHVFATYDGHALLGPPVLARPGKATIRMGPGHRITGLLRVPQKTNSLDHYVVIAWPERGGTPVRAIVEDGGFFQLEALQPATYTLTAHTVYEDEDVGFAGQARLTGVKAGARGVELTLKSGAWAHLALVDEKGTPLRGARVILRGPQRVQRVWPWNDAGEFGIHSLWPGAYRFEIDVDGKGHHVIDAKLGATVRHVIR